MLNLPVVIVDLSNLKNSYKGFLKNYKGSQVTYTRVAGDLHKGRLPKGSIAFSEAEHKSEWG